MPNHSSKVESYNSSRFQESVKQLINGIRADCETNALNGKQSSNTFSLHGVDNLEEDVIFVFKVSDSNINIHIYKKPNSEDIILVNSQAYSPKKNKYIVSNSDIVYAFSESLHKISDEKNKKFIKSLQGALEPILEMKQLENSFHL